MIAGGSESCRLNEKILLEKNFLTLTTTNVKPQSLFCPYWGKFH